MATLDEIFAAMPDAPTAGTHELLIIDPDTRQIDVPEVEAILGVENDNQAERKYFKCPRIVGDSLDLAACSLRVHFANANSEPDAYVVEDLTVSGDYVLFSWELSRKVTRYKGDVHFLVYAGAEDGTDWHTTLASGTVLEGKEVDTSMVEEITSDVITQLLLMVGKQTAAVQAEGTEQIANVQEAAANATAAAQAAVEAKGAATLATIPADYTTLGNQVDGLTRSAAGAIVCAVEGETVQVHDASDHHLQGLRIFGRSTQDGTPTPDAPVEIVSTPAPVVTVTDGAEGNVQTLSITTPSVLSGIPVASGGNYTDANGQQWICDEVDLARGVYVQRVKQIDLKNVATWRTWGVGYLTNEYTGFYAYDDKLGTVSEQCICTFLKYNLFAYGGQAPGVKTTAQGEQYYTVSVPNTILADISTSQAAISSLQEWLQARDEKLLVTIKPVERDLSDEELAAWRKLRSNKPTTTILNDAGAHMAVEYVADTKLYIDGKLAEILAANHT